MLKDRVFFIVVAVALLVMAALVINQTAATAKVTAEVMGQSENAACPFSPEGRASLRGNYSAQFGVSLPRTDSGYSGLDGGVLGLLDCSGADVR